MKFRTVTLLLIILFLSGCVGVSSKGIFGTGVSVALDPRSLGTQIDDSIMQKNLSARLVLMDKKYFLAIKSKVLDGRIFLTGKVNNPEEKLKITKLAWETEGARSVRNDIKIKEKFNFKQSAKDILITSAVRTAVGSLGKSLKKMGVEKNISLAVLSCITGLGCLFLSECRAMYPTYDCMSSAFSNLTNSVG